MSHLRSSLLALACSLFPAAALADVLVVHQNGPAGTHHTIQSAIDAAVDGDVIVLKSGAYPGFTLAGKSLAITALPGQFAFATSESRIVDVPLGKSVLLSRLDLYSQPAEHPTLGRALTVQGCLGPIRIEACNIVGASNVENPRDCIGMLDHAGWPGLWVEGSYDVVVTHGTIVGGKGMAMPSVLGCQKKTGGGDGAPAVWTAGSRLALFNTVAEGGDGGSGGWGGNGANAVHVAANSAFLYGVAALGGAGGFGHDWLYGPGGNGGHGVHFAPASFSASVGVSASGGAGGGSVLFAPGQPGEDVVGTPAQSVAGPIRDFVVPPNLLQGAPVKLELSGEPQELPLLLVSPSDLFLSLSPLPALLLVVPTNVLVLPPIPANGELELVVPAPTLPPGIDAIVIPMQSAFLGTSGQLAVGPARHLIVLAAAP